MVMEDDDIQDADIVVLPPAEVNEVSDCEQVDDNDMTVTDVLPKDVAAIVKVHYIGEDQVDNKSCTKVQATASSKNSRWSSNSNSKVK